MQVQGRTGNSVRWSGIALLGLALVVAIAGPVSAQKPTPPPTNPPAPAPSSGDDGKQEAPPTPVPEDKPTSPPTPTPTKEPPPPTFTPVPTGGPTHTPRPRWPTATPSPTPFPSLTPSPSVPAITGQVTGQVFEDRDGDGVRGPDEPGVSGVPVTLGSTVVGVTGPGGRFSVPAARGKALLAIVPPEGWQWNGSPRIIEEKEENDIVLSLYRLKVDTEPATAIAVLGVALVGALMFVGFASLTQAAATRSLERTYRQHKSLELEHLQVQIMAQRRAELLELISDDWREILRQLLADALPAAAIAAADTDEWITVTDLSASPPHFTVARQEGGEEYVFTVSPDLVRQGSLMKRNRVIPLDASLAATARVEVQAVWQHLMEQHGLDRRALPRQAAWYLVVVAHRRRSKCLQKCLQI